jgi:hypothetical protein
MAFENTGTEDNTHLWMCFQLKHEIYDPDILLGHDKLIIMHSGRPFDIQECYKTPIECSEKGTVMKRDCIY